MVTNDDKKILNAIRLHLVLLNVANEAVQFKLSEIIKQRNATSLNPIKDLLVSKYQIYENQAHPPNYVNGFMTTLREKFRGNPGTFPDDLKEFDITACYPIAKNFLKNEYLIRYKLAHTNDYLEKCHQLNSLKLTQVRPCFNVIKKVNKNIETFEIVDRIDSAFKESFENARVAFNPLKQRFVFFDGLEILAKSFDLIIQTAPMLDDLEQEYNKNFFYQDRIELLNKNTYLINKSTKVPRSIEEKEMPIPLIVTNQLKDSVNNPLISEKKLVENIQIAKISNPIRNEFLPTFKLHSANRVEIAINLGKIKIEGLLANLLNNSIISELNLEKNESFYLPSRIQLTKFIVVYTDIIEPQFYGNVRSPILRTVNIKSQNDENSTFFDNPHYLNVNKTRIDTINIQICDLSGKHIQFRDFFSNIQITLHFRKKE
jgi:hypothetical protein